MKKKNYLKWILLTVALLSLAAFALTGCGQPAQPNGTTEPAGTSSVTEPEDEELILYWNVDGKKYRSGTEKRQVGTDGFYHVNFAFQGAQKELKVTADTALLKKIDAQELMGLVFDENGVVVDMASAASITGGFAAWKCEVTAVEGKTVKFTSPAAQSGAKNTFTYDDDTKIYIAADSDPMAGTVSTEIAVGNKIIAVQDKDGRITHVYVIAELAAHTHCLCGGLGTLGEHTACDDTIKWLPWDSSASGSYQTTLPAEGYYYLTGNVNLASAHTIEEGQTLNLCLNGYNVSSANRAFAVKGGTLNLVDCQKDGDEYKGTVKGNTESKSANGGVVYLYPNSVMNVYGGNIRSESAVEITYGGVCYAQTAVLNLYDGNISGGKTAGYGGNIYLTTASKLNMYGGTISGGEASAKGAGNVAVNNGSTFNLHGGTVTGGKVTGNIFGGNIRIAKESYLVITGGAVTEGSAQRGGNIYASSNTSKITISGGTVTGATKGGNMYLEYGESLVLGESGLEDTASFGITMTTPGKFLTTADENDKGCFTPDKAEQQIVYKDGALSLVG